MTESVGDAQRPAKFRLGRVVLVLVPLAAVVTAVLLSWGYYDVGARIARWRLPPLVPVSGQVYLNGAPLDGAQIFTLPVGLKCRGAMGLADKEGRFTLRTDVDGDFLPGARVGEHRVVVQRPDPNVPPGPFKPPLITPPDCAEFDTTPLRLQVDRDAGRNQVEFRLAHRVEARKPGMGPRPDRKPASADGPRKPMGNKPGSPSATREVPQAESRNPKLEIRNSND